MDGGGSAEPPRAEVLPGIDGGNRSGWLLPGPDGGGPLAGADGPFGSLAPGPATAVDDLAVSWVDGGAADFGAGPGKKLPLGAAEVGLLPGAAADLGAGRPEDLFDLDLSCWSIWQKGKSASCLLAVTVKLVEAQ